MSEVIKIRKGLNINIKGKAEKIFIKPDLSDLYAVKPPDFHRITPKLTVQLNDHVKAGSCLFYDKNTPVIKFTSPVSGTVFSINRGERRRIQEVVIKTDPVIEYEDFKIEDPESLDVAQIKKKILESGLWPAIKQRPYNIIASPDDTPKGIFISAFDTAPLAPDYDFITKGADNEFQTGINALRKLTHGQVHLNVNADYPPSSAFANAKGVQIHKFRGKHPAGNIGIQIHHIDPINKGELAWVIGPQEVIMIGRLFLEGKYDASKIVALAGSEVLKPLYYKIIGGASIKPLVKDNIRKGDLRYISGNVLTGSKIEANGYIGYYDSLITVLPEGKCHEFFGWASPGFNKLSISRSFWSWLAPGKEYKVNTNFHGGFRSLMITGVYEKVLPMDIYPMQLIKSIIIEDVDLMEKLGIYEVAEEDFALCEFVCTSKTEIQELIRNGLDLMIKEMS